jgi:hypothetical protein
MWLRFGIVVQLKIYRSGLTVHSTTYLGTVPVTISKSGYTSASGNIAFKANSASKFALTVNNSTAPTSGNNNGIAFYVPVSAPTATLTAQLYDVNGNKVTKSGVPMTFTGYKGTGTDSSSEVTFNGTSNTLTVNTDENGVASVNVGVRTLVGQDYTVKVTTDASGYTAVAANKAAVTLKVANTAVTNAAVTLFVSGTSNVANTVAAGTGLVNVQVKLTDNYGSPVSGMADYLRTNVGKVLWDAGASALTDNTSDYTVLYKFLEDGTTAGTYWLVGTAATDTTTKAAVAVVKSGVQTLGVNFKGNAAAVSGAASVLVNAASASKITFFDGDTAITSKTVTLGTVAGPIKAQLRDTYDNNVSLTAPVTVAVAGGTIRATADGADKASFGLSNAYNFYVTTTSTAALGTTLTFTTTVGTTNISNTFVVYGQN